MNNKHIYWKLQSINNQEHLEVGSKEFNLYREKFKKDFETRQLMSEEETLIHYNYQAWKFPMYSKVFSLTLAYVENNQIRVKYIIGEEKDLIVTFLNTLKSDYFKEHTITHFGAEYVLPYLGLRMDKNGIITGVPLGLQYKNERPWTLKGCCVRDYYTGAGNYKYTLKELAWVYGLETSYIESVDEFTFYKQGKLKDLKVSAIDEISTLVNVHRLMVGEDAVLEVVSSEEKVEAVAEIKPQNWLEELYNANQFTKQIYDGLKEQIFSKKKPTKKEKEKLFEIIRGVYVRTNFENKDQDTKKVIEQKEKEIKELLEI